MSPRAACSLINTDAALAGTALTDQRLLIVEHQGPWGRDAASAIGRDLTAGALAACDGPARLQAARHPGRLRQQSDRHWWAVSVRGPRTLVRSGVVGRGAEIPRDCWPTDDDAPAVNPDPTVFVCTNGRRDPCCALYGRALVNLLPTDPRLWEISHISGHRFAPTAMVLPSGLMLGRLDERALRALLAGGLPDPATWRGLIGRDPSRQVAELHVAAQFGMAPQRLRSRIAGAGAVSVTVPADGPTGNEAELTVRVEPVDEAARPASCGAAPQPTTGWRVAP